MIFDTDILIWAGKGNFKAADLVGEAEARFISVQTYLELLQKAQHKQQHERVKNFLADFQFKTLLITENISHRAMMYIEEYGLSHNLGAGDALIAATAVDHNLVLVTGNEKHFRAIKDLKLKVFKP